MNASICPTTLLNAGETTTSSLAISACIGQSHDQVMQGIRKMLTELKQVPHRFMSTFKDQDGQTRPMFSLDKRLTTIFLMNVSPDLREKILDRMFELEERAAAARAPINRPQALRDYADRLDQEEKDAAQLQLARVG